MDINSWSQFVSVIESIELKSQRLAKYLFRGQADSRWLLEPSFSRFVKDRTCRWALDREYHMQRLFRLDAHNYIQPPILPSHTNQLALWWSAMQHYGVATRLLDWSCSPYVALYFAIESISESDAALWIVHPHTINNLAKEKYSFSGDKFIDHFISESESDLLWFYEPAVKTDRMSAQQCWFSVAADPRKEHSQIIRSHCDSDALRKLIIPSELKAEFLSKLHYMNISSRTVYPGLDGFSKSIQEFLKIEAKVT